MGIHARGARGEYHCEWCRVAFSARVADRQRGWAKFCSKTCKAMKQEKRTHQFANLQTDSVGEWAHPFDSDGHGQWES